MKGKEIIRHAVRAEMPDMEQLRQNSIQQASEKTTVKDNVWLKRIVSASACLVAVVLAIVIFFPYLNDNSTEPSGTSSNGLSDNENNTPIETAMQGLPVENFNLADVQNGGMAMSRIGFMNFGSFFEWDVDCFVVVKVSDTQTTKEEQQISDVIILQNVYGECTADTTQIRQYIYKDHFCLGSTNLLRKGGAYLLPLKQSDGKWYIIGDMDVLFEIDDKGLVWSHSDFEDFNRYDGKSIESLIDELQNMVSNDDFMLANSPISVTLRYWTLADITISSKSEQKTDTYGFPYYSYVFTVNEILSEPNDSNATPLGKTGSIKVYADEEDTIKLFTENRYLICLDRYEDEIYVNSQMIAKIKDDETITAMPSDKQNYVGASIFTPYDGNKISDIRDLVSRIHSWREIYE